jgi:hypothetical protein
MSHFYGFLSGNRGEATRCGSKSSGINAHIKSWNNDVEASLKADDEGNDILILKIPEGLPVYIAGIKYVKQSGKLMLFNEALVDKM